jgi:hypothetical protein
MMSQQFERKTVQSISDHSANWTTQTEIHVHASAIRRNFAGLFEVEILIGLHTGSIRGHNVMIIPSNCACSTKMHINMVN